MGPPASSVSGVARPSKLSYHAPGGNGPQAYGLSSRHHNSGYPGSGYQQMTSNNQVPSRGAVVSRDVRKNSSKLFQFLAPNIDLVFDLCRVQPEVMDFDNPCDIKAEFDLRHQPHQGQLGLTRAYPGLEPQDCPRRLRVGFPSPIPTPEVGPRRHPGQERALIVTEQNQKSPLVFVGAR